MAAASRRSPRRPGGLLGVGLWLLAAAAPGPSSADGCEAVCREPASVAACNDGRPVWGFREPSGICRGGSFGYLESRDAGEAERLRIARSFKRRCDEQGDCERFEALDRAEVVCLACSDGGAAQTAAEPAAPPGGRPPPCDANEWLQRGEGNDPGRCFVEFAALPPRLAMQGRCAEGDCRAGVGTVRWPSGESYSGHFVAGRRDGQGTFRWPDGRRYVGSWEAGQPHGLGTRIYSDGRFRAGYFARGRYLGEDATHAAHAEAGGSTPRGSRTPAPPADRRSCEELCTEDAELTLSRIHDEFECCFARHAFCSQKARVAREACRDSACARAAARQQEDCDLHYACDAVQTQKVQRFRRERTVCVEGCASQELDEHGLRVSERGTLLED